MTRRSATVAATALVVASVSSAVGGLTLATATQPAFVRTWVPISVVFFAFAAVGWLLASRVPANPLGWLVLLFGCLPLATAGVQGYAVTALHDPAAALPAGGTAAWIGELPWMAIWSALALILLLFPDARPASPRWRWAVRATIVNGVVATVTSAVAVWPIRAQLLGDEVGAAATGPFATASGVGAAGVGLALVAGVVSLLVRYRRSDDIARAQLRWVAYAACLVLPLLGLTVADQLGVLAPWLQGELAVLPLLAVPAAIGVAVTRYRLYAIDRLVSRTVSYAVLTVLLGGVYISTVLLLTPALASVGGGSALAVAGATLATAAVFRPARRRIQLAMARRFDRCRYDAVRAVDAFRHDLRGDITRDIVADRLARTANVALQPAAVGVWLHDHAAARPLRRLP